MLGAVKHVFVLEDGRKVVMIESLTGEFGEFSATLDEFPDCVEGQTVEIQITCLQHSQSAYLPPYQLRKNKSGND